MSNQHPRTISILATSDTSSSTLFGLYDVLSTVGLGWEQFVSGEATSPQFDVRIVATDKEPIKCGNALVTPHNTLEEMEDTDIAVIASFAVPGLVLRNHKKKELEWLLHLQNYGATIGGVCTAASLMAECGLLNGLEATTYWAYRDLVRIHYPKVHWRTDQNLCIAGVDDQIVTAGGATSWQEMALYLIARYCGVEHAAQSAKFWVMPDRGESQAPYSANPASLPHDDSVIRDSQTWIAENYTSSNPITGMIHHTGLAPTTFSRRFKLATGDRPMNYVHMLRIEKAKELLEADSVSVDEIGHAVGYGDPASFRRIFKRKVSLTPSVYRRKFGHSRFNRYQAKL